MSSITGVGQGLYQFLQSISGKQQSQSPANAAATAPTSADATSPNAQGAREAGRHSHHHGGGLFQKIESAVTTALDSAKANGSSDPNKVIEDAIAKVFKDNGVNPPVPGATPPAAAQANDPDHDGDTHGAGKAGGNPAQQAFAQLLASFGIDSNQFHQDFLAAIKDAQGGQVNPSTAFQSIPPGTAVDTTA